MPTQHGYLVLADISGYTSYLAGTELEHAHEILTALLETIVEKFKTVLTISKLEGDAVFGYVSGEKLPRGETLLELLESTYMAFRSAVEAAHRSTTCTCNACRAIPMLDLKFMAHYGDFIVQNISGIRELVGSDVNLVHRLMKNHIAEATGWHAYALFTETSLTHMGVRPDGLHAQPETYEHLGEVKTLSFNMRQRYQELRDARHIVIKPEEAFLKFEYDLPAPPPVVWDWLNDPLKRAQYAFQQNLKFVPIARPAGRTAPGALNHCVHGKDVAMVETVLDWRPFDYLTVEQAYMGVKSRLHSRLTPTATGTHLSIYLVGKMPVPGFINRPIYVWMHSEYFPMGKMFEKMEQVLRASLEPAPVEPEPDVTPTTRGH